MGLRALTRSELGRFWAQNGCETFGVAAGVRGLAYARVCLNPVLVESDLPDVGAVNWARCQALGGRLSE